MKPDVAHEAGRCPGLPRKASLLVCLRCQPAQGRCQEGPDRMEGCEPLSLGLPWRVWEETAPLGPWPPSSLCGPLGAPETHILEGQEDGQDESTEEQSHEQHKEHALAGGEVKLQGQDRCQLLGCTTGHPLVLTPSPECPLPRPSPTWPPQTQLTPFTSHQLAQPCPQAPELTLVWKLKTVTERQTSAVMPRHSSTDVVL